MCPVGLFLAPSLHHGWGQVRRVLYAAKTARQTARLSSNETQAQDRGQTDKHWNIVIHGRRRRVSAESQGSWRVSSSVSVFSALWSLLFCVLVSFCALVSLLFSCFSRLCLYILYILYPTSIVCASDCLTLTADELHAPVCVCISRFNSLLCSSHLSFFLPFVLTFVSSSFLSTYLTCIYI